MARYLHTMVRVTDLARSRSFYEALGMEFTRELDIVRDGQLDEMHVAIVAGHDLARFDRSRGILDV